MPTSTGTGPATTVSEAPNRYGHVVGPGATFAGIDQGIDFTGAAPVFALGSGFVERVVPSGSGWPGQGAVLNYRITSGVYKDQHVYVAEDFAPRAGLQQGTPIAAGQVIGFATGSGKAPGIEMGWADASGRPLAKLLPKGSNYLAEGQPYGASFEAAAQGDAARAATVGTGSAELPGGALGGVLPANTPSAGDVAGHIPGVQQARDVYGGIVSTGKFLGHLSDPNLWLRVLEIVGGGFLLLVGLYLLAKDLGLPSLSAPSPVARAAGAVA